MLSLGPRVLIGVVLAMTVALAAGCGGEFVAGDGLPGMDSAALTGPVPLQPVPNVARPRWLDMADALYSAAFRGSYVYTGGMVAASFDQPTAKLIISLTGMQLKPNFAYQLKLEGQPTLDAVGNQNLGNLGRWWQTTGYLVFGYLVTDNQGRIAQCASGTSLTPATVAVNSSYHVLWTSSQRTRRRNDGPVITRSVTQTAYGYDPVSAGSVTVGVYGEQEPSRPRPGTLVLPAHTYTCLLRLTEESFHSTDPLLGGNWESVLDAPITFEVRSGGKPKPGAV